MEDFESVYKRYYLQVYKFLFLLNNSDASVAEDLCEETFYQAFVSFHKFRGDCQVSTWLCRIAKNVSFRHYRKNRHEIFLEDNKPDITPDSVQDPSYIAENSQTGADILKCILKQKKKYRDILIYRLYHDMQFSEISKIMRMSEENARIIYCRARKKLKEQMEVIDYGA
ncbi:MAG: sigma-70 family RNA polymerase sigma factor [Oscillospiraceae bacterium]|nr:sigma-70 family RNA polymerase sigma factor [Oscillospiraceae bacterium]